MRDDVLDDRAGAADDSSVLARLGATPWRIRFRLLLLVVASLGSGLLLAASLLFDQGKQQGGQLADGALMQARSASRLAALEIADLRTSLEATAARFAGLGATTELRGVLPGSLPGEAVWFFAPGGGSALAAGLLRPRMPLSPACSEDAREVLGLLGHSDPPPAALLAVPSQDAAGAPAVVIAALSAERLAAAIAHPASAGGRVPALFDRCGLLLGRAPPLPGETAAREDLGSAILQAAPEGLLAGENSPSRPATLAYARDPQTGWTVAVEVPEAPRSGALKLVLIGASQLAAGILLALLLARWIERPLRVLWRSLAISGSRQREAEQRHRIYWEGTDESLFVVRVEPDGRFLFEGLNPAHERRTGLSSARLRGREPREVLPPDIAATVVANYRRCAESGAPISYEETLDLPNGRADWETSLAPVQDPLSGRVTLILGSARDITARRRAERALRESEARFRAMAETVPGFVLTCAPGQNCDYVSPAFYDLTGLPRGSAEADGLEAALHPEDAPRFATGWQEAERSGEPFEGEFRFRTASGGWRWFALRKRPVRDAAGRVTKWVGTGTDIQDLRQAFGELELSNQRLSDVLAATSDCYMSIDRDWRITAINRRAAEWHGVTPEQAVGRTYLELAPRMLGSGGEQRLRALLERQESFVSEVRSTVRPGRWIENHGYPTADGLSLFFRDITRRKESELAARQTQEVLQSTLDSLSVHVAILDAEGRILAVNAAWRRFAAAWGEADPNGMIGADYFAVSDTVRPGCQDNALVSARLRAVLRGELSDFRCDYPCHCGPAQRWFQLRVSRFGEGERRRLVLAYEDVTEVKAAGETQRTLAGRVLAAQDEERWRIARELHDQTAQGLLAAALSVQAARNLAPSLASEPAELLAEASAQIERSQNEIRTLSYLLHPPMLDEIGLAAALEWLAQGFAKRAAVQVEIDAAPIPRLPREVEMTLFRVAQEALTNVHRHARANAVRIALERPEDAPGRIRMSVRDDGAGLGAGAASGVGLASMRERMRRVGGSFRVSPAPGGGTLVEAMVPLGH